MIKYFGIPLTLYILLVAALAGACFASFSSCLAYRRTRGEKFSSGRSHCDLCGHTLGFLDLIPVLSYAVLGGKCRYCGGKLSSKMIWTEVLCAAAFVTVTARYAATDPLKLAWYLPLLMLLALSAFFDLETFEVPNIPVLLIILLAVPFRVMQGMDGLWQALLGGFGVALPLLLIVLVMDKLLKKDTMGGGDIKLFFAIGCSVGLQYTLFALLAACLIGLVVTLFAARSAGRGETEDEKEREKPSSTSDMASCAGEGGEEDLPPQAIPFVPFITLGVWAALLFAPAFFNWYSSLL